MATWYVKVNSELWSSKQLFCKYFCPRYFESMDISKTFLGPIEFKINDVQLYVSKSKRPWMLIRDFCLYFQFTCVQTNVTDSI